MNKERAGPTSPAFLFWDTSINWIVWVADPPFGVQREAPRLLGFIGLRLFRGPQVALFVAQAFNWIELRGSRGGDGPEQNTDQRRDDNSHDGR
jgi:hypothetical protein